jgi:hypothetical protein
VALFALQKISAARLTVNLSSQIQKFSLQADHKFEKVFAARLTVILSALYYNSKNFAVQFEWPCSVFVLLRSETFWNLSAKTTHIERMLFRRAAKILELRRKALYFVQPCSENFCSCEQKHWFDRTENFGICVITVTAVTTVTNCHHFHSGHSGDTGDSDGRGCSKTFENCSIFLFSLTHATTVVPL